MELDRMMIEFNQMKNDPHWGRLIKRLKKSDIEIIIDFIHKNFNLSRSNFEMRINRFFLDRLDKPKNWKIINELLMITAGKADDDYLQNLRNRFRSKRKNL